MTSKKLSQSERTHSEYADFLETISLQGIGLDEALVNVDRIKMADANESKLAGDLDLNASFEVLAHSDSTLVASAKFRLAQGTTEEPKKCFLDIQCSFSALFTLQSPASRENVERFADSEAKVIFWPYLRHFISDISYRMAVTPILLPLTVTSAPKEKRVRKPRK